MNTLKSFRSLAAVAFVSSSAFFAGRSEAATVLNEPFAYPDGNLAAVSSGAWLGSSFSFADDKVGGGVANLMSFSDSLRPFGSSVLGSVGNTASFSFNFNMPSVPANRDIFDVEVNLEPNTRPSTTSSENLGSAFGVRFHRTPGSSSIALSTLEGLGNGSYVFNNRGTMSADVVHTITGTLTRGASNTAFTLLVDGNSVGASTFVMNDARALNTLNLWAQGDDVVGKPPFIDNVLITDTTVAPEPASASLLGVAGVMLLRRRARATKSCIR